MNIKTISSRAFNQDVGKAKRASVYGPVFITDRGLVHEMIVVTINVDDFKATGVELLNPGEI